MAYTITKNGTSITVADDTLNTQTSLRLVGKDYIGYGEAIAQNSVSLLENFASETAPTNPIEGQLWWKPSTKILYVRYNTTWLGLDAGSGFVQVTDTADVVHNVAVSRANGIPVSMVSSNATAFALKSTETDYIPYFSDSGAGTGTTTINAGINLNTVTASAMKFHGTATHAQFADVAENYTSDVTYGAGTVIMIASGDGVIGDHEVTETVHEKDPKVIGVVTTDPALLMNSMAEGITTAVALLGRVPCKVVGPITKGDRIISSDTPGHGRSEMGHEINWRHVIGRALESKNSLEAGVIEVIVGVK
jgi:hypothetical protein